MKLLRTIQSTSRQILRNPNQIKGPEYLFQLERDYRSNTVRVLEDPENDRKLILVGTMNSSDFLAKRTQKLLDELKPDSVLVQTTPDWFDKLNCKSKNILTNQDILDLTYHKFLEHVWAPKNIRGRIFLSRFYLWIVMVRSIVNIHFKESTPFLPSLEVYNTIKYARENDKPIFYADKFLGLKSINGLKIEKRLSAFDAFLRNFIKHNRVAGWEGQFSDYLNTIDLVGLDNFSESADDKDINFINSYLERIIPHQKRIFIDKTDIRIFKNIYKNLPGKTIFALVNHWNMPGIEQHWRHTTQTETKKEFIHPIGDMDINAYREEDLIGDHLRRRGAKLGKTEPGLTTNYITQYHKMTTEPERERHAFFDSYKDPELEHSLYNDENEGVKDLPYDLKHH